MKKIVEWNSYKRQGMFTVFSNKKVPFFSTTVRLDITELYNYLKMNEKRFFPSFTFLISKVVNDIPEFRQRIEDGILYEYDRVDPGYTVLMNEEEFSFCHTEFSPNFQEFYLNCTRDLDKVKSQKNDGNEEKNNLFFITSIPWFSFTSFTHPYDEHNGSVPIITIGKIEKSEGKVFVPLAIQVHHGVMDGLHVGKFFQKLELVLKQPELK